MNESRPQTRADCRSQPRPCPWVTCRYHLFVDVVPTNGHLRRPHGSKVEDIETMTETCALDVAERGPLSLGETALHFGLSAERVRQEESAAMRKLRASMTALSKMG